MNLDDLTLGQIKELKEVFGGDCSASKLKTSKCMGRNICILQRGWIMIGTLSKKGKEYALTNASVVRSWGTSKGIGEIALNGPTGNTRLDPCGEASFHELTVVAIIPCVEEKWSK